MEEQRLESSLFQVVLYLFNVFHDIDYLTRLSLNREALELFTQDVNLYSQWVRPAARPEQECPRHVMEQVSHLTQSGLPLEQQKALFLDSLL